MYFCNRDSRNYDYSAKSLLFLARKLLLKKMNKLALVLKNSFSCQRCLFIRLWRKLKRHSHNRKDVGKVYTNTKLLSIQKTT